MLHEQIFLFVNAYAAAPFKIESVPPERVLHEEAV